jgi:large subunit ribosomal protein L21
MKQQKLPQKGCPGLPEGTIIRIKFMFAVIKTGGKQYKVAANDVITVERLEGVAGDHLSIDSVLMLSGASVIVGSPNVAGACIVAELIEQGRGPKVISFKKRRRQNSKRKKGHRQDLTVLRIAEILTDGQKPGPHVKPAKGGNSPAMAAAAAAVVASASAGPAPKKAAAAKGAGSSGRDESNLSLIAGIGPTIEKKLRAAGIATWSDIAGWSDADIEKWNETLALRGRVKREEWVEQAKELLAGKPPRAKVDQAEAKSGEDV